MDSVAIALVIAAALCHATWNVAAKSAGGDVRFALFTATLVSLLWLPVAWWFARDGLAHWDGRAWIVVAISALIHVGYFATLLRGYCSADLTVVYPVARGTAPLLSASCALLLFGEALSTLGAAGVLAIVAGVFLIAGGPRLLRATHAPERRGRVWAGIGWGALTGVQIAAYTLVDGYAVKVLLLAPILFDYFANVLRLPMLLALVWRQRSTLPDLWRAQWRAALVIATLGPIGYVLALYAMQRAPVSVVAPARELSMLFAALLGGTLLREQDVVARVAGAGCIALGVTALIRGSL